MKKGWTIGLGIAAAFALMGAPERAQALTGYGYVCSVRHMPRSYTSVRGDFGYLWMQLSTQVNCGGTVRSVYLNSEGATDSSADPQFLYSEAAINTMMRNAAQAAMNQQTIYFDINDTKPKALRMLEFR